MTGPLPESAVVTAARLAKQHGENVKAALHRYEAACAEAERLVKALSLAQVERDKQKGALAEMLHGERIVIGEQLFTLDPKTGSLHVEKVTVVGLL